MTRAPLPAEVARAGRLLPGPDWRRGHVEEGGDDHVVLVPGDAKPAAVIRIARHPSVAELLSRRMELLERIAPHLPWATPVPLSPIDRDEAGDAVALSFIAGTAHPPHTGDPVVLQTVLDAIAAVPDPAWHGLVADAWTSTPRWDDPSREAVTAVLPSEHRKQAGAVWAALDRLVNAPIGLVHGDLAGHNMHWHQGSLVGVLDWDHAAAWDPAINLAHLALWHGLPIIDAAAPVPEFAARASVWVGHFALFRLRRAVAASADGATLRWDRLLRKTLPRLDHAAAAAAEV